MSVENAEQELKTSPVDPKVREVCERILDALERLSPGDGAHLGFNYFVDRIGQVPAPSVIPAALTVLCSLKTPVLSMHGYLDDDKDGQVHLNDDDLRRALLGQGLVHPISGEHIASVENEVRIFYAFHRA